MIAFAVAFSPMYGGELPPEEEAVVLPQPYLPDVAGAVSPSVPDRKEKDEKTDAFLKGAFCVISALFFITSYIIVKSNEGYKT